MVMWTIQSLILLPLAAILYLGTSLDVLILLFIKTFKERDGLLFLARFYTKPSIVIKLLVGACAVLTLLQLYKILSALKQEPAPRDNGRFPARPMLFPCRTSHVRMFPKKHGFAYSYLLAGVPVGWKGAVGGMLSADTKIEDNTAWYLRFLFWRAGNAWFTVNGDDYLERGHVEGGLEGKLRRYLESQVRANSLVLFNIADICTGNRP